jgi:small subunit ribosomal protein S9
MTDNETLDVAEATEVTAYSSETPAETKAAPAAKARGPLTVPGAGLGRRKQAIARVRLVPGSGAIKVNGRELADYFPNKLHQQLITDPFTILELSGSYDVVARITGGGTAGQAGALRLGIARALNESSSARRPVSRRLVRLRSSRSVNHYLAPVAQVA